MPRYKANGKTYDIPESKVAAFEKHNPDATLEVYDSASGKGYNIPVAKAGAFKKKFPKWSYDAPQTASRSQSPEVETQNSDMESGSSNLESEIPSAPSAPPAQDSRLKTEDSKWTPTPIQKAFALNQVRNAVEGSRQRMQKAVDDSRRLARSMTQEGRDELKAGQMQASVMGLNNKPIGLSPSVGSGTGGEGEAPFRSAMSPQVSGVKKGADGKYTTEYMLPDGSLTTDFTEADRAEYNARSARLQHEFEKRMAANGLDPSRQEDIDEQRKKDLLDESGKRVAMRLEENESNLRELADRKGQRIDEESGWNDEEGFWDNMARILGSGVRRANERMHAVNRPDESLTDDERDTRTLLAENSVLNEARKRLETRDLRRSGGFMGGFWNIGNNWRNMKMGARHTLSDPDLYANGVLSLEKATQMLAIEDKLRRGGQPTDAEVSLLYSTMLGNDIEHNTQTPHGYNAAQITVEMFPFMAQMMLNPASGLSDALVRKFGKSGLRKVVMRVAGDVAESAALANTLQAPATAADAIKRYQGEAYEGRNEQTGEREIGFDGSHSWASAIGKAEGAATIENYTEMLGEHFGVIGNALGKGMSKGARKVGMGKVVDAVSDMTSRIGATEWVKAIGNLESRAHWNGVPGEILEEEAGIVLNSALVGDNRISDLWDADQQIDIALGVGLFGGFVSGIKTVGYPIGRARAKGGLRKADGIGGWRLTDEWDGIRTEIEQAEEPDLTATVQRLVSDHAKSREQAKAIADYARALMKARGYNIAVAKAAAEGVFAPERLDAEESFAAGEEIAGSGDADAMRDVRLNLERQRERLAKSFGDEWISENLDGDDPLGFVADMEADGEARQMALDYVNARHVYEGMLQGVRDDIDSRIAVSDAEIDGRTHRATGMIQPATMKMDDRAVYVVSGDVVMTDDGTAVDEENSSESVIVCDAATGKLEFVDPAQILALGEAADASAEKQAAADRIRRETAQEAADAIDGRRSFLGGESYTVLTDMDGGEMTVDILGPALDGEGNPLDGMVEVQLADGTVQSFAVADLQEMMDQSDRMRAEIALQERQMDAAIDLDSVTPDYSDADIYVAPGIGASDERAPLSPLGWIPKDENGAPLFEQAPDAETGWDALVEDSEGDEAEAMEWAKAQVKLLEKEAAKAGKALANVPATTDRGKWKADRRAAREVLESVEARLKAWQDMLAVPQARADEAARQAALAGAEAEAEAIRRAQEQEAARKAEEARLEAAKAEADRQAAEQARLERERRDAEARAEAERLRRGKEERDGIPDILEDTPAAARERGARRSGTTVYRRQQPIADKVEGKEVTVDFNEKREGHRPRGRIVVIEAAQGQASHMEGERNPMFFIDEAQPKDRTDAESILAEQRHAREMDPSLITDARDMVDPFRGAPTVNSRGETIQGNHSMATLRYMYANERESSELYRAYLIGHAAEFGFTPEQAERIASMKEPVLVNMVDVDDSMAIELGQDTGNSRETGGKDRIDAQRLSASIGDRMGRFMDTLLTEDSETDEGASLRSLIRRNGLEALKYLRDMGKIDDRQYSTAVGRDGNLSDEGVEDIEKFIRQAFFAGESREFADMFDALPAKAQGAVLAQMWRDAKTAEADKAAPHVKEAVRAFSALMSMPQFAQARNFKDALAGAEMWRRQMEMGEDGDVVDNSNRFSNFAIRLAAMMKGSTMKETRAVLKQMLDWMQAEQEAEPSMFDMMDEGSEAEEDRSFAGAVRRVLDMEYQPGESSPVIPGRSEKSERSERSEKSGGTRNESPSALEDKTESKTDKTDRDNGNGENGGPDVAGGVQESPQGGKRGSRGNDKGGKRTEGRQRPAEPGAGAGTVESPETDGGKKKEKPRGLTEADLDGIDPAESGIDGSVIDAARDYLRGDRSQWNEMCYKIVQDYVRNTGNSIESLRDAARPAAEELPGADAEAAGPGEGRDGGAPDGMDRGDGGSDRPGGREGGEDGARGGRALPGEEGTGGTEEEGSVSDDGGSRPGRRGGGRRAGGSRGDVRKPGGKKGSQGDARNDGSGTSEAETINGGSAEAATSKREDEGAEAPTQTQIKADDGEASADAMISDALADIRDILSNPAMTRRGQLNDVTTLIAGLGVNAVRFMGATAKLGCGLVLKGFYKFAKWRGEMHRNLDPLLFAHTDLTDEQADEFIRSAWDMKMTYRGERRKISEWASILEQEELRRLAQMGIAEKRKLQAEAEDKEVVVGDIDNIRETLPFLLPAQHEDVEKAERQFFKPEHADREHGYGKGYLFTNGTGTGKTYTGLGIVKRFLKQGKGRVLIVTVNDTKISDWIKDARNLGIEATQLADTKSKGKGVVVTQYANLRQNYALLEDQFDLIVYDESHKLMENQEGEAGSTAEMHHMVAARDARSVIQREVEVSELGKRHREAVVDLQRAQEINNLIQKPVSLLSKKEKDMLDASGVRTPEEAENLLKKADEHVAELANEMERVIDSALADPAQRDRAEAISKATKTVFLSATPFNTPASLDYSEGYIFSYEEGKEGDDRRRRRNAFLRKNFGKSHRPNKNGDMTRMSEGQITDPQGVEEEEIRFSNYLQETLHTMSGRMLDSAFDYSRSFPRFEFEQAAMLNEALAEIAHGPLASAFKSTLLDYNYSTAFWEIIKTGMALDRIKEHLALGRKVVVFHRRKASNQGVNRPFRSGLNAAMTGQNENAKKAALAFAAKYAPLLDWELTLDYTYPQDRILNEFVTPEERKDYEERMAEWEKRRDAAERAGKRVPPEPKLTSKKVGIFNGDQTAREKQSAVDDFILDGSEKDVIVVQVQSGKEGISLHDTTGKHQRVMMSLALPQSPIEFIQAEGRIYRVGNQSNAIFEYPLLGIDRELFDFAMKINGRSQTSENLAMGDKSRGLRDSITRGALGSTQIPVAPDQGVGGKMLDSRQTQTQTDFDQAMINWKEWRDKDAELTDYDEMQIPDPLGFKLMEWAGLERGETVLVGYAGEGSAARYAPSSAKLIAIESESGKLARLAALLGGGGRKILDASFMEDDPSSDHIYSTVNKADIVIVKAKSGSYKEGFTSRLRAARDVFKALQHTEDSGRVLAIVPSANLKGVDGVLNYVKQLQPREGCTVRSIVNLPASLFGNAVSVVVIDKNADKSIADAKAAKKPQIIDVEDASTVEETLASLRDVEVEKREVDRIAKAVKRVKRTLNPFMESTLVSTTRMRGNGSQKDVHVSRYGVNVHFKKHVVPNRANYASFWNGLSIDFDKLADRSYLEEIANYWAGARKYADMSIEEYAEERGHRFRNDAQLQEAHSLLENICALIEAATGKTATQLANIAEGRVENEIKRDMTVGEFKDIYKTLDSGSEELDALAERVFAVAAQIPGLTIKLSDGKNFSSHNVMAHYAPGKNAIELNADNFNSVRHTDMQKAQCILHETIHAVTCWAVAQYKDATDEERRTMGPLADACRDILDVFKAINNDAFRAQLQAGSKLRDNAFYGLTDEYEMLAEMANPAFRQALKAKRLWRQLVNGIKKLFGIDVTDSGEGATTAFDALNRAINTILDNFDAGAYADYQAAPHFSESTHEMRSLFDERDQPGPSAARQQSLFGTQAERDARKAEDQAEPGAETASRRGKESKKWVQASLFGEEKHSDGNGNATDAMGNPIDGYGRLIIEDIAGLNELSDADFTRPTRNVGLPPLPEIVQKVLSTNGKKVVIKKNIFERNAIRHNDLTPEMSRRILSEALYNPTLYGKNKPLTRPNNWIVINVPDGKGNNKLVVLEVNEKKDNVEIVHWHEADKRGLDKIKRQAEREDGQLLILPSETSEEAGALSGPTFGQPNADLSPGSEMRLTGTPKESEGPDLVPSPDNNASASPLMDKQSTAPESSAGAMDRANAAIDEYAERFADLYAKYSAFIEGRERLADDLWDRLQDELELIGAVLEQELGRFYLSEGNSEEDAARMARDKAGLVRAEVTMQLARPEIMMRSYSDEGSAESGEEKSSEQSEASDKPDKPKQSKPKRSRYRSAADEVLEWQSAEGHLPALKEGEFAYIERQFVKDGMFPFLTGAGKIKSDADVAYLFRCLENSAIEQTFAVLVRKGKPLVVHIGMGSQTASVVDKSALLGALQAYGADKVYFVHNHPSGNLRQSPQDDNIARRIREIVGEERMGESIIIDTTSGRYAVFGGYTSSSEIREMPGEANGAEREHGVLSFSRQVFAKDYDPEALTKIRDSKGVAEFVSTRRLGEGPKVGYLLLSRQNSIIGAMQSSHPDYSDPQGLAREAMGQAAMRGAVGVILYGNAALEREPLRRIRETLEQESGGEMRLLDAMRVTSGLSQGYVSAADSSLMEPDEEYALDPWTRKWGETAKDIRERKELEKDSRRAMRERIRSIAEPCGVEVEVLEDASGLDGRKRDAKGWFDPRTGRIVIVLSNNASVQDAEATLLHEMVAHKGLRDIFGDKFDSFLDAVWEHADDAVKERISLLASRRGWDRRTAVEEYMAQLAEDGSFKEAGAGWWQKLKALFMDFLRGCGFSANVRISDAELRYVLWMSWKNLQNPGAYLSFLGEAERIAKAGELGLPALRTAHNAQRGDPLFRDGDFTVRDRRLAASIYEGMLREGSWQFREATQDSMLGLRSLYEAVLTQGDKRKRKDFRIEDVAGYENAYLYENRMSSANCAEQHEYFREHMAPLLKSIHALCGRDDDARRDMTDYMMAKHGLERNAYMRAEAVAAGEPGDRDFAGLCGLTGEADWRNAEAEAQRMVDDYEAAHDPALIDQMWADTKKATQATLQKIWLSGLISDETYQKTLGMYDHYIPLRGWDETTSDEVYGYLTSPDGPLLGSVWKHAEGRESKADDPIATIAKMADDAIRQGNRNVMKQRMLNFVHGNPSDLVSVSRLWLQYDDAKDEWHPVFADLEPDMTPAEIAHEIKLFEEKMEGLAASDPDHYKSGRDARRVPYKVVRGNMDEHQVLVKRNGHTYVMTINGNPRAAQALNGLTNPDTDMGGVYGKMLKGASYINRQLSAFYTTRNPDFVMSNFLRDALYSNCMTWVKESPRYALRFHRNFGRVNPIVMARLLSKWQKGSLSSSSKLERAFAEFMRGGGETGYTIVRDIERHKREIDREIKRIGSRNLGAKTWRWLQEKLDLLNRSVENTARFAAFLTSREMGRSLDRSIHDAKEISVNFNKKGAGDRFLDAQGQTGLGKTGSYIGGAGRAAYVFWNAGVQGMTNFMRAGKRNPKKAMAAAASLFTLGSVIPLLAQLLSSADGGDGDDDRNAYYNLPEYIRRSNICFRVAGHWVTIPLPIEFRAIYGLGELSTGVITGQERYSDTELAYYTAAQLSQILPLDFLEGANPTSHDGLSASSLIHPFIPSFAKPFTEAYVMNRGWTGMPVSKDTPFNQLDPEFKRVYQSTDQHLAQFSRWLNNSTGGNDFRKGAIDINPAKVEYMLNGTFGGMFSFPMKVKKTGETIFGDREFEWRSVPLANRVVKTGDERTANRKLQSEYYKYRAEARKTEHEFRGWQKEGARGVLESARRADRMFNSPEFLRWQIADAYEPTMSALRKAAQEAPDSEKSKWQAEYYSRMRELVDALRDPETFIKSR